MAVPSRGDIAGRRGAAGPAAHLRTAALALGLVAPTVVILGAAAIVERDAMTLAAAGGLAALAAVLGTWLARGYRRPALQQNHWLGLVIPLLVLRAAHAWGGRWVATLPPASGLRFAVDQLDPFLVWTTLPAAGLLTLAMLGRRPSDPAAPGMPLGVRLRVFRIQTVVAGVAIAALAVHTWRTSLQYPPLPEPSRLAAEVPVLEQRLALRPASHEYHRKLGYVLLALDRYPQATDAFTRATHLDASNVATRAALGYSLMRQNRPFDAVPHLRMAAQKLPDDADVAHNLASVLHYSSNPAAAESVYRAMMIRRPQAAEWQALAGLTRFETSDRQGGADEVRAAFARDPNGRITHFAMAKMLTQKAELTQALPHFRAYLTANPDDGMTWAQYAQVAYLAGEDSETIRAIDRLEVLAPGSVDRDPDVRDARDAARARLAARTP